MIKHGKKICKSRNPKCGECTLRKGCPYGKEDLKASDEELEEEEVDEKPKRKSWTQRRKRSASVGDIEDLVKLEADSELMFVCGVIKKSPKMRKSV
jgi:adenine-specific DNA glycosylase